MPILKKKKGVKRKRKGVKNDYQAKKLKNPFYSQNKKKRRGKWWKLTLALLVFALLVWLFFISPVFKINKIEVKGLSRVSNEQIKEIIQAQEEEKKLIFLSEENFFLFNKKDAQEAVNGKYNFAKLRIIKRFPNKLIIEVNERPYAFIFLNDGDMHYASQDGYLIYDQEVKDEDIDKYFILENNSQRVTVSSRGKINIKDNYLDFVFLVKKYLDDHVDLSPDKFIIDQEMKSLLVLFKDGPKVYFNVEKDAYEQVDSLALVKNEKIRDNFNVTSYIDLRYGEFIYIK